ncbi:hypothetical protein [Methylocystis parvus]|nr:hypothetical protein [Methylocystis parvus]
MVVEDRPGLAGPQDHARKGDVLVVWKLDWLEWFFAEHARHAR